MQGNIHNQYFTKAKRMPKKIPENRGAGVACTPVFGLFQVIS